MNSILNDLKSTINRLRHVKYGYLNYYLNIRCYEGYYYLNYIQNRDGSTQLGSIFVSCRELSDGLLKLETALTEGGYINKI